MGNEEGSRIVSWVFCGGEEGERDVGVVRGQGGVLGMLRECITSKYA